MEKNLQEGDPNAMTEQRHDRKRKQSNTKPRNDRIPTKRTRWPLVCYDALILALLVPAQMFLYGHNAPTPESVFHILLFAASVFYARYLTDIYHQVWRYGGIQCYIRLLFSDAIGFVLDYLLDHIISRLLNAAGLPFRGVSFSALWFLASMNLLFALAMRMIYRYAFKCGKEDTRRGKFLRFLLKVFAGETVDLNQSDSRKVKLAIVGAGRVGVTLSEELMENSNSVYTAVCFIDTDKRKTGREIHGIPVIHAGEINDLGKYGVQEVVLAIPGITDARRRELYNLYTEAGYKVKVYDYPMMQTANPKRQLRELDIEELLFRKPINVSDGKAASFYKDKVILITGGGGSIGSELCRQLVKMSPKQIVILDVYENGAYDVQQELRIAYSGKDTGNTSHLPSSPLSLEIEICSITNKEALRRVFERYRPQIVINAAAHKHVPLMEKNCIEAVQNNVFGTKNLVELCEEYGVARFMMISTDKAVNPTNVMGATKRMCEMIVLSASTWGKAKYSCTRFGNVLGSAGSVIPLFKKQIANGGPVTLTDKRIIRYFMTIPEASQLVLESGAMANNGELFVLDMGSPVKIYDLAKTMIHISGAEGVEIKEIGLRPGEKLYEELLVKTEELTKTENNLIFIEKDTSISREDVYAKLALLEQACLTGNDDEVRSVLKQVVPTYRAPEEVNASAEASEEMQETKRIAVAG